MKKMAITVLAEVMMQTMVAADTYPNLTVETIDGQKTTVPVESLFITVEEGFLNVSELHISLATLKRMYFTSDEGVVTGIASPTADGVTGDVVIYDLQGRRVKEAEVRKGEVYVQKSAAGAQKIIF